MKRQVQFSIIVSFVAVLLILSISNVIASPGNSNDCSTSSCHNDPTGITITLSETSFNVDASSTFNLNVQVEGISGQNSLTVKFPSDVASNSLFSYGDLGDGGQVDDGDTADSDPDTDQIEVDYVISAPTEPGTYSLEIYAVQHVNHGAHLTLTIEVAATGDGPIITNIGATPPIPVGGEDVVVTSDVSSTIGIDEVILQYSSDNRTSWTNITMTLDGGEYQGTLPGQAHGTYVVFRIVAIDSNGIESISGEREFLVGDIPVEPLPVLHYGFLLGVPALGLAWIGTALEYYNEERFTKIHGIMLGLAYILTSINVISLFASDASSWTALNPTYLIDISNFLMFNHSWHIWLGIVSMIFGTLAFITHIGGWKTCNLGLPAVLIWTILGIQGIYLGMFFVM